MRLRLLLTAALLTCAARDSRAADLPSPGLPAERVIDQLVDAQITAAGVTPAPQADDATVIRRSMWMLRVVDLPAAIAARGFPAVVSVSVPLRVSDQVCPRNAGSWQLTVTSGTVACE